MDFPRPDPLSKFYQRRRAELGEDPLSVKTSIDALFPDGDSVCLSGKSKMFQKADEAAKAIAAPGRLRPVAVENAHAEIGARIELKKNDAVGSDAELSMAKPANKSPIEGMGTIVDQDEIVSRSFVLTEDELRHPSSS
jgi:hypothetical protein